METGFDNGGASVYSEAKGEYTKQLCLFVVPSFHRFFMELLNTAMVEEPNAKRQLWKFQEFLSQIPEWNLDKVQRETQKLVVQINCDYLEELITAVFIAHTKVLTAIRIGNKNKRVQITIPKIEHFLHRALSESSRLLWSNAYLFHNELPPMEKQKNHRQIEQLLNDGVMHAIRGLLPVKSILKDYLSGPDHDEEADADADDEDEKEEKEEKEEKAEKEEKEVKPVEQPVAEPPVVETVVTEAAAPEPAAEETPAVVKLEAVAVEEPMVTEEAFIPAEATAEPPVVHAAPATTPASEPAPAPAPEPAAAALAQPGTPTFVVDTEPSVRFTNFDQVIQQRGETTHIGYVEKDRDAEDDDDSDIKFMDDTAEPLSDFEDLLESPAEALNTDDFETLP